MKDAAAREAALDVTRSFIVQAPAGSGKTELLVQRFLRLLATCEKPEQVLAITFTRKAAAEMRKRVLERLPSVGLSAAEVAHRLRIQTIDAFCTSLTRQVPVLARFGAQPAIVEDASELYAEAAARVFADLKPAAEKLLAHLDNDVPLARRLLADMLRGRDRWLRRTGAVPTRAELEAALLAERNRLLAAAKALHPAASEELARQLLTKEGTWRKRDALAQSFAEKNNEGLRKALCALCSMPPAKYDDAQWEALDAILSLLKPAVAQLEVLFGERGQADFTAFAHGALRALGSVDDPSDLLLSLDQKIAHILVDEFQDTSQSQFTLLEKLTAGWQPGDGRTLFVVGDPMQSIYRFREAEVSLFLKAREAGVGNVALEPLTLSTNRRSQEGLIAWFNDAFARVLPAAEDQASGAVPYLGASPYEPKLPGTAVSWHCFYDREAEAQRVLEILKNKVGSAAILVRNRAHLDEIVPALKTAGVRWRAIEIEQLGEKQVVQDLYALTRALVHPGDRIAWLAVLRAPWCGLTLADLLALSPSELVFDALASLGGLSADGQRRAARLRDVLAPIVKDRLRGTLRSRVEGAWLALGGPACAASATELEDAQIFLDELEKLEEAGDVELAALEQRIERLYALPDLEADADAVEIMTIHRAKGLEFDTVIVPGLDRLPRSGPKPLMVWKTLANGQLLLAPIDQTGAGEDPTYRYIRELDKEADDLEAGRLFYVAATRAKQRLHLLACARATEERAAREPARRALLAKVWWQACEHFGVAPAEALEEKPRTPIRDVLQRLPAGFALPPAPAALAWQAPARDGEEATLEFSWAGETARHIGTIVHRWLQRIADDRMEGWDATRVDALREHFSRDLQRRGVPAAEVRASAERVASALKGTLADERGRWILRARPDAQSERRLRVRTAAGMRSYVVDRVFVDDDGTRWVVDFKTSRHEGGDAEAFLDLQRTRYAAQMQGYAQALPGARLGLYFPLLGGWREL